MPTVVDRLIQQALHQVMQPIFEPTFSASSYGFRPGRNALQAVEAARGYIREGLSNILLTDLDRELEKRRLAFCRYADDSNIYVRSEAAGQRVMRGIRAFLEEVLRLRVNEAKSAVEQPWKRKFLGLQRYMAPGNATADCTGELAAADGPGTRAAA